jgi:MarR family transcriptional regulator for hemolysin
MSSKTFREPIGRQLAMTAKLVAHEFNTALVRAGGSLPTWLVLNALQVGPEWSSQHHIARSLGIEGATLTRHLDVLEAAGLVVRRRDDSDRRAIRVELTEAGRELHGRLTAAARAFDRRLRAGLDDVETDRLRELLLRLEANLGRAAPQGTSPIP